MHVRSIRLAGALLAAAMATLPGTLLADRLIMKNGDVISGDIASIIDQKVNIKPAYTDAIAVNLADVATIEADENYQVVLQDGTQVEAQFAGAKGDEQNLLVDQKTMVIPLASITVANPPRPYYKRVSHTDLNATWNEGNTDSQDILFYADTRLRLGDHRHFGALTIAREKNDGVQTKKQDLFGYEYNWMFNEPWYLGATASYERDPIKDLDHRYTLGAMIGRDLIDNDHTFLTASLGAGWSEQEQEQVTDSGGVALWNLIYEQDLRDGTLAFFHNHNITYQFFGENDLIFKSNTGFRFDLMENIYANLSFRYDYETEPAPDKKHYDATLAIGLGAEF